MVFLRCARHVVSTITLSALLASCAFASQPSKKGSDPDRQAREADKQSAADQRGTEQSPIVVKIQPAAKTNAEAAEEQREKDEQSSDRRLNRGLAIATAVILFFQLIAIGFQARIASKQNKIMETQSTIMSGQLIATKQAAEAAITSSKAATDAIYLTHRAKVEVRAVMLRIVEIDNHGWAVPHPWTGHILASNSGTMDATMFSFFVQVLVAPKLPMVNPAHAANVPSVQESRPMPTGYLLDIHFEAPPQEGRADLYTIEGTSVLYVLGFLKYMANNVLRRTYFCYEYSPRLGRFVPVSDTQYSYAE